MQFTNESLQKLKTSILVAFEGQAKSAMAELINDAVDNYSEFDHEMVALVNSAMEEYGRFDHEETPVLLRQLREAGIDIGEAAKKYKEALDRSYRSERELHELKDSLEQKRHWLPLIQRLRDILASENRHDIASVIDNYIASGHL